MRTKIKIKLNRGSLKVVYDFLSYIIRLIRVEDMPSLVALEALEVFLARLETLKHTQRKSYTFNLDITTANALSGILFVMKNTGDYERVLADELTQEIKKQIERAIHIRKYSDE